MKKIRLDTLLVEQDFADANAALRAVLAHEVKVNDVYANSAAVRVAPDAEVGGEEPQAVRVARRP